jgi:eukaryotic-like serine/threonine-protein kinase
MLNDPRQPSFRTMIAIGMALVDAFAALHASGLCYRDINFTNLRVDAERAEVAVIDNDNVGVDGGEVFVKGTLRFMAPEIVRDDSLPSMVTDMYSLAVLLFMLFMHGHPLEGGRTDSSYNWTGHHVSETELVRRHFGEDPRFIFDPDDASNRPVPGNPVITWWAIYPRFFRQLFQRAFTSGLTDATLGGRVIDGVWRRALSRLSDCISVCPACRAAVFWDPGDPDLACWRCHVVPPPPARLELGGHRLVLAEGTMLSRHHVAHDGNRRDAVGVVEAHPDLDGGQLVLRNLSEQEWSVTTADGVTKRLATNRCLKVRPVSIDFGPRTGQIVVQSGMEGK